MRLLALMLISALSLASSSALAASYQRTDGSIVDPIQLVSGGDHPYPGINLQPQVSLFNEGLSNADLSGALGSSGRAAVGKRRVSAHPAQLKKQKKYENFKKNQEKS